MWDYFKQMKTKTVVILGGAAVALYLVYSHHDEETKSDGEFAKGYTAGWLTPGPFTIVAMASLLNTYA